jgi:hypothetical protein
MPASRRLRLLGAAIALALFGAAQLTTLYALVTAPQAIGPCSIDLFGLQFGPTGSCYFPIGEALLFAVATLVVAVAMAVWPQRAARPVGFVAGFVALASAAPVLGEGDLVGPVALSASLVAVVPFLVFVPTGPAANMRPRRIWITVLVASAILALLDSLVSGIFSGGPRPQAGYVVVGLAVLAAGWLSGRLEPRAVVPTGTATAPAGA